MNHRSTRFAITMAILLIISLACSSPFQPAATQTPVPSATLAPTSTDTPEPTPTFTATPDRTATRAAESTAMAAEVIAQFRSEMSEYEISTDTGYLGWMQTAPITLTLNGVDDLEYQAVADGLEAGDFIFSTDITWQTESLIQCGLVFRADSRFEEGEHYEFWFMRFSGLPLWEIQFWDGWEFVATASNGGHSSSALDQANGATNRILIVAEDFGFTVFINGIRQGKYFDFNSLASSGQFGFTALHDTSSSTCKYENTVIWVYR